MRVLATIEGESINELDDGMVTYTAKCAVDTDGSGDLHGDPCAQADTSLHWQGKPLNADDDKYIVVPPVIIHGVEGAVLGCQAWAKNVTNGMSTEAVVGDIGPHKKLGEGSNAFNRALGLSGNPNSGGTEKHIIHYSLKPGLPAVVDGKQYALQPYRR